MMMSLSSAAFFAENFAGTVSVFAGAPGTAKAPLTSTAFAGALPFGGGCCWAAARPMLPTNASASALVRTRSHRMAVSFFLPQTGEPRRQHSLSAPQRAKDAAQARRLLAIAA